MERLLTLLNYSLKVNGKLSVLCLKPRAALHTTVQDDIAYIAGGYCPKSPKLEECKE